MSHTAGAACEVGAVTPRRWSHTCTGTAADGRSMDTSAQTAAKHGGIPRGTSSDACVVRMPVFDNQKPLSGGRCGALRGNQRLAGQPRPPRLSEFVHSNSL